YIGGSGPDPGNGVGYSVQNGVATSGGSGTGLTINVLSINFHGGITDFSIATGGSGYVADDIISINGGSPLAYYQVVTVSGGAVTLLSNWHSADDINLNHNYLERCGVNGGQGDGIDIKDGNTNVVISHNYVDLMDSPDSQNQCITAQSAMLIENNFCATHIQHGISLETSWNNVFGKSSVTLRNNIISDVYANATTQAGSGISIASS